MTDDETRVSSFYSAIMDTIARNNAGIDPLKPQLDAIEKIAGLDDLKAYLEKETPFGGNPFYSFYVN